MKRNGDKSSLSIHQIRAQFSIQTLLIAVKLPYFVCAILSIKAGKAASSREICNREGKPMMFLLRTAFWLTVIILLLPNDEEQRSQIYGTAQAAVNDVTTFCDRNPSTCATGQEAFAVLVQKAQYGAELLMDLMSKGGDESASILAPLTEPVASTEGSGPALWERADSQDTLSAEDREVAWGAPDSGV